MKARTFDGQRHLFNAVCTGILLDYVALIYVSLDILRNLIDFIKFFLRISHCNKQNKAYTIYLVSQMTPICPVLMGICLFFGDSNYKQSHCTQKDTINFYRFENWEAFGECGFYHKIRRRSRKNTILLYKVKFLIQRRKSKSKVFLSKGKKNTHREENSSMSFD